jgi:hypothetical protein
MKSLCCLPIVISLVLILFGCSTSAIYKPPIENLNPTNYSKVINKSFDDTWDALINYSAGTFFGIENFEKESGLITLSFGASKPEDYVTGGYWKVDVVRGANSLHFEGDYVEYCSIYQNGTLMGKMNIVVKEIDSTHSKVTANAKYVFTAEQVLETGQHYSTTWSFTSESCDEVAPANITKGTPPTRTLCPTFKAEDSVLKAIEAIE